MEKHSEGSGRGILLGIITKISRSGLEHRGIRSQGS